MGEDVTKAKFQNGVLSLIIHSNDFVRTARRLITPGYFQTPEQLTLCQLAFEHFDKYGIAIRNNISHEVEKFAQIATLDQDRLDLTMDLVQILENVEYGSESYYADELVNFAQHAKLKVALEDFMPEYSGGRQREATEQLLVQIKDIQCMAFEAEDLGIDYKATLLQRHARRQDGKTEPYFPSLIDPLDEKYIGIRKNQLASIMAPSGQGKSWFLIHLGKAGIFQGLNVFHYSTEMAVDEIEDRYDQMLVGISSDDLLQGIGKIQKAITRHKGQLILKYLPSNSSVADIRNHIETVSVVKGIYPDMVILDYGDELRSGQNHSGNLYLEHGEIWRSLKGLAVEMHLALYTATQPKTSAQGAKYVTEMDVGLSKLKLDISDIFIGFNRNLVYDRKKKEWVEYMEDEERRTIRLNVIKHRGRPDKYKVHFISNLERGLFYSLKETTDFYLRGNQKDIAL